MKTSMVGKYATFALFSFSFIALNNCGSQSDSANDSSYKTEQNGPASDLAILPAPYAGYLIDTVLPLAIPAFTIETMCDNGVDDDGNGWTDCEDPRCHIHAECSQWGPPFEEIVNSNTLTVYPNGLIVPEDVAFRNTRGSDDDDSDGWLRNNFFALRQRDCWISPVDQDPYYHIPLGEAMVAGPDGPIGPQLFPPTAIAWFGPRAGLIDECEGGTDLFTHGFDDDNGSGAGSGTDAPGDEDGGDRDDE